MVSARPAATWLARKLKVMRPNSAAMPTPAQVAARTATSEAAGLDQGGEGGERTDHHHAFHAQVEDAGALGHELAGRRQHQRRGRDHDADQDIAEKIQPEPPISLPLPAPWTSHAIRRAFAAAASAVDSAPARRLPA